MPKKFDIHRLPVVIKKHVAHRLAQSFDLNMNGLKRCLKTGKIVRRARKEGESGMIESKIGRNRIRLVYTIREKGI